MRVSTKGRADLTSEDSHSEALAAELASADDIGLTHDEADLMRRTVAGDAQAARAVAGWMIPLIHTPETVWSARLRRVKIDSGMIAAESIFTGPWPNPMKPMIAYASVDSSGLWRGMRPSPRQGVVKWAPGFRVELRDHSVYAECATGHAEIETLAGEVLWQVDVEGASVKFREGS